MGARWSLARHNTAADAFVLAFGERRLIVRGEWGSGTLDLLDEDGKVKSKLEQMLRLEGPISNGVPLGAWSGVVTLDHREDRALSLMYRDGQLVDLRKHDGERELDFLN